MQAVNITRPSTATQRVLGSAVAGLFAANGFAAAILVQDHAAPGRRPAAISEAAGELPGTVTLITTRDGRHLVADQRTAAGRKAVSDARRDGATVQTLTIPLRTSPSDTTATVPGTTGGRRTLDLGALFDDAGSGTAVGTGPGAGGGVFEIGQGTLDKLLQDTRSTVTSLVDKVGSTPSTITSIVGSTPGTATSIVGSTPGTATSIAGAAPSTVTSVVGGAPSTITTMVGSVPSTITSVLPTIAPPVSSGFHPPPVSTTTVTVPVMLPGPVCGLLAHC
jgi:hypothetical protein